MQNRYAVAVLIDTPDGIPLVRDPNKPNPFLWKLPGGRSEGRETPRRAAVREIVEEVGIVLDPDQLREICRVDKGDHEVVFSWHISKRRRMCLRPAMKAKRSHCSRRMIFY